ncbi:DUF2894 domain-containing protein [Ferribacterium limneticum]|uniref:DUF2894 domain-containing protein n=1 Tax=Ferribacterium limneticum TaxID=76259 RepID=UPI001CFA25B6|nr:DUF2894 domain-containing protein [Ferribacterium limneticum]UCV30253.1 DUF2894 domain-containing protein [Ferribacterium limneticum]UCV34172.1 DUF2894 domain-containing protein [Ferribacterium limneticum]
MAETGDMGDIPAQLDALRASGAADRDPVRFAFLEALARRAGAQPEAIRQSLNAKISAAASKLASRPAPAPSEIAPTSSASPLAELLTYISQQTHGQPEAAPPANEASGSSEDFPRSAVNRDFRPNSKTPSAGRSPQAPELKSVTYFRDEWSKLSTEQQLTQTLAQAPDNAGPMNSQHLVLRSLERMRDIAPDYLQGFMSYIDTLIWLEHADPTKLTVGRSSAGEGEKKTRTAKRRTPNR